MKKLLLILFCIFAFSNAANAAHTPPKDISPEHFARLVKTKSSNHKLIFIFSSWCKVCNKAFPDLIRLHTKFSDKGIKFIVVSLDESPDKLRNYIYKQEMGGLDVYRFNYSNVNELAKTFKDLGINYRGGIPHIVLMKSNDEIIADGNYLLASFDKGLEILLKE